MKQQSLLRKYSALSVGIFLLLGIVLGWVITSSSETESLEREKRLTAHFIRREVLLNFKGTDFSTPFESPGYEMFAEKSVHLMFSPEIRRIKVWNRDMTVVWSDDRRLVGRQFPRNRELREALDGKISSEIFRPAKEEKEEGNHFNKRDPGLLELYVPVLTGADGKPVAVFEIYQDLEPLYRDIARQKKIVWAIIFLGIGGAYLLCFSLVAQASRNLVSQYTERKAAEESRLRMSMAIEQSADMVAITDTGGAIEYVNPSFERITGYSRDEVVGRNMRLLKSGRHDADYYKSFWETIAGGKTWEGHFTNRKKDGSLYEEESSVSPVTDGGGTIINFVAVKRDITHELTLRKHVQTAQRIESVGTLAGGIAHDFNNALTGIIGFAEMLRMRFAGDPESLADLGEISRSAERAAALTRQLLTFARRQVVEPVNLNLNEVLTGLLKLVTKVVGEHIDVKASLAADLPTVSADRGQVEQVILNLCLNARDAMPSGGDLLFETAGVTLEDEFLRKYPYATAGLHTMLVVSDTGAGMDEATQERIFDPFFTTKGPDKGTGLGMAVVYGIVKQHKGFIHVYSELGKGSTFRVYFPSIEAPPEAQPPEMEGRIAGGNETVLLAEDDGSIRTLAERILTQLGYTVLPAQNGEEAVDLFRRHREKISLAILDVVMPKLGGVEAIGKMRKESPGLKSIFMSGYSVNGIHDQFVIKPDTPFLSKPFTSVALAKKVREALDG